jgi:hypothetical protein
MLRGSGSVICRGWRRADLDSLPPGDGRPLDLGNVVVTNPPACNHCEPRCVDAAGLPQAVEVGPRGRRLGSGSSVLNSELAGLTSSPWMMPV